MLTRLIRLSDVADHIFLDIFHCFFKPIAEAIKAI